MTRPGRRPSRAPLVEVFWSLQGEGRHVGAGMVFVRTAVCPIRCLYCDTPHSYTAATRFPVRAAGGEVTERDNPVTGAEAAALAAAVAPAGLAPPVSITGGEPLVHAAFVAEAGEALRAAGHAVHLETAALDPAALRDVIARIDHLSADYKLPGTLREGDPRAAHRMCIEIGAAAACTVDVKLVLTPEVGDAALAAALDDLAPWRDAILVVLQPVTPFGDVTARFSTARLREWVDRALAAGFAVRAIPQIHPALGVD